MKHEVKFTLDITLEQDEAIILKQFFRAADGVILNTIFDDASASTCLSYKREEYISTIDKFRKILDRV
jgi:hypothetical protein